MYAFHFYPPKPICISTRHLATFLKGFGSFLTLTIISLKWRATWFVVWVNVVDLLQTLSPTCFVNLVELSRLSSFPLDWIKSSSFPLFTLTLTNIGIMRASLRPWLGVWVRLRTFQKVKEMMAFGCLVVFNCWVVVSWGHNGLLLLFCLEISF